MKTETSVIPQQPVEYFIRIIRGQRVILDADLARVYRVSTKRLNQAVKRNADRFPPDFAFRLEPQEHEFMQLQIVPAIPDRAPGMRSQIVTASKRNIRYRPWAFTEHGAIMAASMLNSPRAVQMSVFVVRAFVKMREVLAQNGQLAKKLAELERKLTSRLDVHEKAIVHILDEIKKLMEPLPRLDRSRGQIADKVNDAGGAGLSGLTSRKDAKAQRRFG
jgi:hypothetical protein